jgi:hypothetical protein
MRKRLFTMAAAALLPVAPCRADDAKPSTSFNVATTSDYRCRGARIVF